MRIQPPKKESPSKSQIKSLLRWMSQFPDLVLRRLRPSKNYKLKIGGLTRPSKKRMPGLRSLRN